LGVITVVSSGARNGKAASSGLRVIKELATHTSLTLTKNCTFDNDFSGSNPNVTIAPAWMRLWHADWVYRDSTRKDKDSTCKDKGLTCKEQGLNVQGLDEQGLDDISCVLFNLINRDQVSV
jgi:hypothetical protein